MIAPDMFNRVSVGETLADDPSKLIGRTTVVTLQDLTGDYSKGHVKLHFQIYEIKGSDALTRFIGHDMRNDYVLRLARRHRTKIDGVFDVKTKDGYLLRVKPLAIADKRIKTTQARELRKIIGQVVREFAEQHTFSEFVGAMLKDELSRAAAERCRAVYPLRRLEIRKSEVLSIPRIVERVRDEVEEEAEVEEEVEAEPTPEEIGTKEDVIKLFTTLKGIGPMKAEALYEAGFDSFDKLRAASVEELARVEGMNPTLAKKVKEQLEMEGT
jgi:small subunit ribosomal protein S3Ae